MMKRTTHFFVSLALLSLLCPSQGSAQSVSVQFYEVPREVIVARLDQAARKNADRHKTVRKLFEEAGCTGERLRDQPVRGEKLPNVICTLPGKSEATIIVGAHYDHVSIGMGFVDNWSGAALLPSLYESLSRMPRNLTYVFVAFAAEEEGLVGSQFFAHEMTEADVNKAQAMINIDSLGLGPLAVWPSRSNDRLVAGLLAVAKSLQMSVGAVNADEVGDEDSRPFRERRIRALVLHSVTQHTLDILHSARDNKSVIRRDDYFNSYRLLAVFLALLDNAQPATPAPSL